LPPKKIQFKKLENLRPCHLLQYCFGTLFFINKVNVSSIENQLDIRINIFIRVFVPYLTKSSKVPLLYILKLRCNIICSFLEELITVIFR